MAARNERMEAELGATEIALEANRLGLTPAQQMATCAIDMLLYLAGSNPQHREPLIEICAKVGDIFELKDR
jgi:hypothetical protein